MTTWANRIDQLALVAGRRHRGTRSGMSIFQQRAGRELAQLQGRVYDDHGATVTA